jgi:hypothetical protein
MSNKNLLEPGEIIDIVDNWEFSSEIDVLYEPRMSEQDFTDYFQEKVLNPLENGQYIKLLPYDLHPEDAMKLCNRLVELINITRHSDRIFATDHLIAHYNPK